MLCGFLDAYVLYVDISNLACFNEAGLVVTILGPPVLWYTR